MVVFDKAMLVGKATKPKECWQTCRTLIHELGKSGEDKGEIRTAERRKVRDKQKEVGGVEKFRDKQGKRETSRSSWRKVGRMH